MKAWFTLNNDMPDPSKPPHDILGVLTVEPGVDWLQVSGLFLLALLTVWLLQSLWRWWKKRAMSPVTSDPMQVSMDKLWDFLQEKPKDTEGAVSYLSGLLVALRHYLDVVTLENCSTMSWEAVLKVLSSHIGLSRERRESLLQFFALAEKVIYAGQSIDLQTLDLTPIRQLAQNLWDNKRPLPFVRS